MNNRKQANQLPSAEALQNDELVFPVFSKVSDIEHYNQKIKLLQALENDERIRVAQKFYAEALIQMEKFRELAASWHIGNPKNPKWKQEFYSAMVMLNGAYQLYPDGPEKAQVAFLLYNLKETEQSWGHQMLHKDSPQMSPVQSKNEIKQLRQYAYDHGSEPVKFQAAVSLLKGADSVKSKQYAETVVNYCKSTSLKEEKGKMAANVLCQAGPTVQFAVTEHILEKESSKAASEMVTNKDNVLGNYLKSTSSYELDRVKKLANPGTSEKRDLDHQTQVLKIKEELQNGKTDTAQISLFGGFNTDMVELRAKGRRIVKSFDEAIAELKDSPACEANAPHFLKQCKDNFSMPSGTSPFKIVETLVLANAAFNFSTNPQEKAEAAILYAMALKESSWHFHERVSEEKLTVLYEEAFKNGNAEMKFIAAMHLCNLNKNDPQYLDQIIQSLSEKEKFGQLASLSKVNDISLDAQTKDAMATRLAARIANNEIDPSFLKDKKNPLTRVLNQHDSFAKTLCGGNTKRLDDLLQVKPGMAPAVRNRAL